MQEGAGLAASFGCPFMEASAKMRVRCEDPFFELVREIRKQRLLRPLKSQGGRTGRKRSSRKCTIL